MPEVTPWSNEERLARERQVIGFYVTGHPLSKYEVDYKSFATIHMGETEQLEETAVVKACGVITSLKTKIDKAGKTMAFFTLDDFSGSCESLMFSKIYEKSGQYVQEEKCVFIIGRPESSGDAVKLHIEEVIPLEEARERFTQSVKIYFDTEKNNLEKISQIKSIMEKHKGSFPVYVHLANKTPRPRLFFLRDYRVDIADDFLNELNELLGEDSVILTKK